MVFPMFFNQNIAKINEFLLVVIGLINYNENNQYQQSTISIHKLIDCGRQNYRPIFSNFLQVKRKITVLTP